MSQTYKDNMDCFASRYEEILRENERLRMINDSVTSDYKQLLSSLQGMAPPVASTSQKHKITVDEEQFRAGLQPRERRTSSPVNMATLVESTAFIDSTDTGFASQETLLEKEVAEKLLGEIAYQLDRRILSYVFQCSERFYGYNLTNIPSKIIDASTHPLSGKVDEEYRLFLNQRYENIKDTLSELGYKITLHPQFSEYIVNKYGILQMRPTPGSSQATDYYNPSYLKRIIETTAPSTLQKDLMILLNCLNNLAKNDKKPILLW